MGANKLILQSALLVLLPALIFGKAIPDETEQIRDARGFDSLVGGGLGRDLSHTIRKLPLAQRSRMDTLTGFGLGRSFDNDYLVYQYPPWMSARPEGGEVSKRGFDQIDSAGFGQFSKRNFDPIDRAGFGQFSKRAFDQIDRAGFGQFSKRSFDQIDSAGFGQFTKRNFDKMDRPGLNDFMGKRDMGKRNFDTIDRAGFGTFSRR